MQRALEEALSSLKGGHATSLMLVKPFYKEGNSACRWETEREESLRDVQETKGKKTHPVVSPLINSTEISHLCRLSGLSVVHIIEWD